MNQTAGKAIFITAHEFLIILCKRETTGIMLPQLITDISADDKDLKTAMGELITDGYLIPGNEGLYQISPELNEMLDLMDAASHTYVIMENDGRFFPMYLYRLNMQVVALSPDKSHKDWIRLEMTRLDDKIYELLEYNRVSMTIQRFRRGQTEPEKVLVIDKDDPDGKDIIEELMEE